MKRMVDDRLKTALLLVFAAFVARMSLSPLEVDYGNVVDYGLKPYEYCNINGTLPVDFGFYVCSGERLLEGKTVYKDYSIYPSVFQSLNYPPAFPLTIAATIYIFGVNFIAIKSIAVVFDVGLVLLIYLAGKRVRGENAGLAAAALYGFSYIPLMSSGLFGTSNHGFMFMTLYSVYLALSGQYLVSALALGIGLMFKVSALLYLPPILYYVFRRGGWKKTLSYSIVFCLFFAALIVPFALEEGKAIAEPFLLSGSDVDGLGFMNLARLTYGLPYHLLHPDMLLRDKDVNDPMNLKTGTNPFAIILKALAFPFRILAFALVAYYASKNRLKNREVELFRNIAVLVAAVSLANNVFFDFYTMWFIPYALVLLCADSKKIGKTVLAGFVLTFCAVFIHGFVWTQDYFRPMAEVVSLNLSLCLAVAGAYLMFGVLERRKRLVLTGLTAVCAYYQIQHALPLRVFYPLLQGFMGLERFRQANIYGLLYLSILGTIAAVFLILREVHRETRGD